MNLHKPLPCKKCISYAMCIHRKKIVCNKILDFLSEERHNVNWHEINQTLPKADSLQYEVESKPKHLARFRFVKAYSPRTNHPIFYSLRER